MTTALFGVVTALALLLVSDYHERDALAAYPPGANGKIVFTRKVSGVYDVWVMDPDGSNQANLTLDQNEDAYNPRWSPDGTKIAYEVEVTDDDYDIWLMNADGSGKSGIAEAETLESGPVWSPDGTKVLYYDGDDIWQMDANGSNRVRLTDDPEFECCPEFSPDGSRIFFDAVRSGDRHIWRMGADGSSPESQAGSVHNDLGVRVSPDGQMLAFYNSGEIYSMDVDGTNRQQLTDNSQNEFSPTWSADGSRIIFTRELPGAEALQFGVHPAGAGTGQIFSMTSDGTDLVNLSNSAGYDSDPDVQVLPAGLLWGDSDCDGDVTSRDNQALLREVLQQNPLSQTEPCPDLGTEVNGRIWGDWDCDGAISSRDNQALLRAVLQQNPLSQTEPCPDIGAPED